MNTKPLLILSLALNVVFGVVIITTLSPETDSTVGLSGTGNYSEFPLGKSTTNSHQVVTNTDVKQMTWEAVEAPDYREYIENLWTSTARRKPHHSRRRQQALKSQASRVGW